MTDLTVTLYRMLRHPRFSAHVWISGIFWFLQGNFLCEIFMHCFWIGSVFRGAHRRSVFLRAALEEAPRSRGEAPTTTHSLLSREAGLWWSNGFLQVCGSGTFLRHYLCKILLMCFSNLFICAQRLCVEWGAKYNGIRFWFLALNTMTGKRNRKKNRTEKWHSANVS